MDGRFRKLVRATAWMFLAWTSVDLLVPSLCALDQERELPGIHSSATRMDAPATDQRTPDPPVHIDDCFCCSHCVNVTAVQALEILSLPRTQTPLPVTGMPMSAGFPPYHPPRV